MGWLFNKNKEEKNVTEVVDRPIVTFTIDKGMYYNMESRGDVDVKVIEKEPPSPTTRICIMELVLVNNKTDKEYIVKSKNDFGITWEYAGKDTEKYQVLCINQKNSVDNSIGWASIGRFTDFSILNCIRKTFDVDAVNNNKI